MAELLPLTSALISEFNREILDKNKEALNKLNAVVKNNYSRETCDEDVYNYGEFVAYKEMTKAEADTYCASETLRTGRKHDWHYFANLVRILAIPKAKVSYDY